MTIIKNSGVFVLGCLFCIQAQAGHLEDARKFRSQGKNIEAALAASKGCMESEGLKSCSFLCALGLETSISAWVDVGCGSACSKGEAESCTTLGSRKVMSGQSTEGIQFLRLGCRQGDKLGCGQLKLMGK